ncbi:MAG: hypothetical protein V1816_18630 [Pseudomonadota bacterium]
MSRNLTKPWCLLSLCLILLLAAGLAGCDGGGGNGSIIDSSEQRTVKGWLIAQDAVAKADVGIFDKLGLLLNQKEGVTTNNFGSFLVFVSQLPTDFRVVAGNGLHFGEAFQGVLSADFHDFDPETDYVRINLVTTIVSAYLDEHPEYSLDEVTARVKSFLELPEWYDIGGDLSTSASWEYFYPSRFLKEAEENGGINSFIDLLVAEIDGGGPDVTHSFPLEGGIGGGGDAAGAIIAKSIVQGSISYIAGQSFGFGLRELGLSFGESTPEGILELQRQMKEVSDKLNSLTSKMNDLIRTLNQVAYDQAVGRIMQRVSDIIALTDDLQYFYTNTYGTEAARNIDRADLIEKIKKHLIDTGSQRTINDQLIMPVPGASSLLKLWSQLVKGSHYFLSNRDYPKIKTQFDFFDTIQAFEMLLLVEYYHAVDPSGTVPSYNNDARLQRIVKQYEDNFEEQNKLLLAPVPHKGLIHTEASPYTGNPIMIYEHLWYTTFVGANNLVATMNRERYLGFNNWRKVKGGEINNFFKYKPDTTSHLAYLAGQGWEAMSGEIYLAGQEEFNCSGSYCEGQEMLGKCSTGWIPTNFYEFYMMSLHNAGIWTDIIDNEYHPLCVCHWLMVREMTAGEINNYFW